MSLITLTPKVFRTFGKTWIQAKIYSCCSKSWLRHDRFFRKPCWPDDIFMQNLNNFASISTTLSYVCKYVTSNLQVFSWWLYMFWKPGLSRGVKCPALNISGILPEHLDFVQSICNVSISEFHLVQDTFKCCLGPSLLDWSTMIHWNVVPTVFHNDHISQGLCKIVQTTFQCIGVLQSQEEGPEK